MAKRKAPRKKPKADRKSGFIEAPGASDIGAPHRQQHGDGLVIEARQVSRGGVVVAYGARAQAESPVQWLLRHVYLDMDAEDRRDLVSTAEWLQQQYKRAGLDLRVTSSYEGKASGARAEISLQQEKALRMFGEAMARLAKRSPDEERAVRAAVCSRQIPIPQRQSRPGERHPMLVAAPLVRSGLLWLATQAPEIEFKWRRELRERWQD